MPAIVERVPPPTGDAAAPLQGLIFDSHYDAYKGVVAYVRVFEGTLKHREWIKMMSNDVTAEPIELGFYDCRSEVPPR